MPRVCEPGEAGQPGCDAPAPFLSLAGAAMILDKQNELSNAQVVTASAASVNQVDLGPPAYTGNSSGANFGNVFFNVETDFAAAGAATLQFGLRSSPNADMSSPVVHLLTPAVPVASLKRGSSLRAAGVVLPIPENVSRYVDVFYTVATGPFTAGAISARVTLAQPSGVGA